MPPSQGAIVETNNHHYHRHVNLHQMILGSMIKQLRVAMGTPYLLKQTVRQVRNCHQM